MIHTKHARVVLLPRLSVVVADLPGGRVSTQRTCSAVLTGSFQVATAANAKGQFKTGGDTVTML
jgi:hypothetical protein